MGKIAGEDARTLKDPVNGVGVKVCVALRNQIGTTPAMDVMVQLGV